MLATLTLKRVSLWCHEFYGTIIGKPGGARRAQPLLNCHQYMVLRYFITQKLQHQHFLILSPLLNVSGSAPLIMTKHYGLLPINRTGPKLTTLSQSVKISFCVLMQAVYSIDSLHCDVSSRGENDARVPANPLPLRIFLRNLIWSMLKILLLTPTFRNQWPPLIFASTTPLRVWKRFFATNASSTKQLPLESHVFKLNWKFTKVSRPLVFYPFCIFWPILCFFFLILYFFFLYSVLLFLQSYPCKQSRIRLWFWAVKNTSKWVCYEGRRVK